MHRDILICQLGLRPNYTIIWIIVTQKINKEEVKLKRKLYQKLVESSVSPSPNLGASSRKYYCCNVKRTKINISTLKKVRVEPDLEYMFELIPKNVLKNIASTGL